MHDHDWEVSAVEFDEGLAVRELSCSCGAVDFDFAPGA